MPKATAMAEPRANPLPQLYLFTPEVSDGRAFVPILKEVLGAGEVACLLLNLVAADDGSAKKAVREIATVTEPAGTALLLSGWHSIAARAGADGVHVSGGRTALSEALASFKPERIVGVGAIRTRHDAMFLAETGVDYVMFGEPSRDGRPPPLDQVVERTDWWAELFEVPCVAYAPDLGSVPLLADAGADFVALGGAVWTHERGPVEAIRLASRLLSQRESRR
jgi:thiamine-phosphate pyrophosphorylase